MIKSCLDFLQAVPGMFVVYLLQVEYATDYINLLRGTWDVPLSDLNCAKVDDQISPC